MSQANPVCRYELKLKEVTDRHSLSLIDSLVKDNKESEESSTLKPTILQKTFLLHEEQEGIREESQKIISYIRNVSLDTILFILIVLSCLFCILIIYTNSIHEDFLYNSISFSTATILVVLVCRYVLVERTFGIFQGFELVTYLIHPNVFTPGLNKHFHMLIFCRLHLVLKYLLRNRVYLNIRADRVVESNGSSPNGIIFALKAELRQMDNKTLLLIYAVTVLILSHFLYVAYVFEESSYKSFVNCMYSIVETTTLIGYQDPTEMASARVISILALLVGQCLNSTMILINVRYLTMRKEEKNAHELFKSLLQREQLQKSAVKLLEFNHLYKNNKEMNHPSEYHKISMEIRNNRKSLYKTTREGVVENLSINFMEGCYTLKEQTQLTFNFISKVISALKKGRVLSFNCTRLSSQKKVEERLREECVALEQEETFNSKKRQKRVQRRGIRTLLQ